MCKYCDQLQHVLIPSPVTACPVCARPLFATDKPHICSRRVLYALIHQNTFANRWNDIQTASTATRPTQLHPSLNSPPPVPHIKPPRDRGNPSVAVLPITPAITRKRPKMITNLALTNYHHTINPDSNTGIASVYHNTSLSSYIVNNDGTLAPIE